MSDEAVMRGPNYDWKHEAKHYREECDKLRDLLHKVEVSSDRTHSELEQARDSDAYQRSIGNKRGDALLNCYKERDQLREQLAVAREALEWYAKLQVQDFNPCMPGECEWRDLGEPARATLARLDGKGDAGK